MLYSYHLPSPAFAVSALKLVGTYPSAGSSVTESNAAVSPPAPLIAARRIERVGAVGMRAERIGRKVRLAERPNQQRRYQQQERDCQRPDQQGSLQASAMKGYHGSRGGTQFSLIDRALVQRIRFRRLPALSLVPLARPPPNGCCPTTAPVGLSFL